MDLLDRNTIAIARIALAVAFFIALIVVCVDYGAGDFEEIDAKVASAFESARDDGLISFAKLITYCANPLTIIIISLVLLILPSRMKLGVPVIFATVVGLAIQSLMKVIVHRPRPEDADMFIDASGYSFPSGHATSGLIFYLFLMVLLSRLLMMQDNRLAANLLRFIMIIFVFLIGMSRIYLNVHYFSDVLAGWLLGATILTISVALYEKIWPSQLRISYAAPEWDAIPRNHARAKRWRRPVNRGESSELMDFPKKRQGWTYPNMVHEHEDEEYEKHEDAFGIEDVAPVKKELSAEERINNRRAGRESSDLDRNDHFVDEHEEPKRNVNPIVKLFETFELIENFFTQLIESFTDKAENVTFEQMIEAVIDKIKGKSKGKSKEIPYGNRERPVRNNYPERPIEDIPNVEIDMEALPPEKDSIDSVQEGDPDLYVEEWPLDEAPMENDLENDPFIDNDKAREGKLENKLESLIDKMKGKLKG